MRSAWAVCARELRGFFTTPIGYVILGAYALISGLGFTTSFLFYAIMTQSPSNYDFTAVPDFEETFLSPYLVYCGLILMFIGPLITMRLLAEERNQGTIELLFTHPLRDRHIVAGKYMAAVLLVLSMVSILVVYVALMYRYTQVEAAVLGLGLVAVFLMGAAFVSLGLFISALCKNQITAATMTFGAFFVIFILGFFGDNLPETSPAPAGWPQEVQSAVGTVYQVFRTFVIEMPVEAHARDLAQGILAPADLLYYFLFITFFLFLTFRALEARRWRI